MSISEEVNAFLYQNIMYDGTPFELRMPSRETIEAMDGAINHRNFEGGVWNCRRTHGGTENRC